MNQDPDAVPVIRDAWARVGLVGYGEVGRIFAAGLRALGLPVVAWDLKFAEPDGGAVERAQAQAEGVEPCDGPASLCAASDLVISAVTASNTLEVARQLATSLRPGTVLLDLNSASPGTKQQAAQAVEAVGAHYVEAGV